MMLDGKSDRLKTKNSSETSISLSMEDGERYIHAILFKLLILRFWHSKRGYS